MIIQEMLTTSFLIATTFFCLWAITYTDELLIVMKFRENFIVGIICWLFFFMAIMAFAGIVIWFIK